MFAVSLYLLSVSLLGDPLAPARAGQLQCYTPDESRRTCRSIASYNFRADGVVHNQAVVLLEPNLIMKVSTLVDVRDGAVCGHLDGIDAAEFIVEGHPADAQQTFRLRKLLAATYGFAAGREYCTQYTPEGEGYRTALTVDGVPMPQSRYVIWVDPADGYRVAP